jgi:hypothetical protein
LLTALKQLREVRCGGVLRTLLQSPALLDGSQGPQEQHVARCAGIPSKAVPLVLLAWAGVGSSGPVGGVEERRALGRARSALVI